MRYAIILAGGRGTRFWPLSRERLPKQFLRFFSNKSLFEQTVSRISRKVEKKNIFIATNRKYDRQVKDHGKLLGIPERNVFSEPLGKSTLAPIVYLSLRILKQDKQAVIIVSPSDHCVKQEGRFLKALEDSCSLAKEGALVTLGIKPDRPETGYGYIKIRTQGHTDTRSQAFKVERFIEKPALDKAKQYIKDKRYYWNAGIFVFRPDVLLEETRRWAGREHRLIERIKDKKSLEKLWPRLSSVSIDYAVMEKTERLACLPADFGWSDLGSWKALEDLAKKDRSGNISFGNCVNLGNSGTIIWSDKRLVATIGLQDMIIVNTEDALLVCAKDRAQDVREIVQVLRKKGQSKRI
jgi:mannose-1-phosphate guanylyltransferase